MDDFRLEEAIDGLGESVVVAVADAAHGRFDAGLAQPLGVADGQVLRPAVGMVGEARALDRSAIVDSLFEGIEHEACMRCFGRLTSKSTRQPKTDLMTVARSRLAGTPFLLRAARTLGIELFRDRRKRGLAAVLIGEHDVPALIEEAKELRRDRASIIRSPSVSDHN